MWNCTLMQRDSARDGLRSRCRRSYLPAGYFFWLRPLAGEREERRRGGAKDTMGERARWEREWAWHKPEVAGGKRALMPGCRRGGVAGVRARSGMRGVRGGNDGSEVYSPGRERTRRERGKRRIQPEVPLHSAIWPLSAARASDAGSESRRARPRKVTPVEGRERRTRPRGRGSGRLPPDCRTRGHFAEQNRGTWQDSSSLRAGSEAFEAMNEPVRDISVVSCLLQTSNPHTSEGTTALDRDPPHNPDLCRP